MKNLLLLSLISIYAQSMTPPRSRSSSITLKIDTEKEIELNRRAIELYGMRYKKPLTMKCLQYISKKLSEDPIANSPQGRKALNEIVEEDSSPTSSTSSTGSYDWLNEIIIEALCEAELDSERKQKEAESKADLSYKKAKLALYGNIATALITATVTILTLHMAKESDGS